MATKKQILTELIALQKNLDRACKRAENISLKIDLPSFAELFFIRTQVEELIEMAKEKE